MRLFRQKSEIHLYGSAEEFASTVGIGPNDFILASRKTYEKYFAPLKLAAHVEYKSKYGACEPTDVMIDSLIADYKSSACDRIIAIGGGSVIGMAKVLTLKNAQKYRRYIHAQSAG